MCTLLRSNASTDCEIVTSFSDSYHVQYEFSKYGTYYFDLANCNNFDVSNVSFHVTALNPDNEHLGTAQIPMPTVYGVFANVWLLLLLLGAIDALCRTRRHARPGLAALLAVGLAKALDVGLQAIAVHRLSVDGVESDALLVASTALGALSKSLTLAALVALGKADIKTVEDFAGLIPDDLVGYVERKDGETNRTPGALDGFDISRADAEAMIMQARLAFDVKVIDSKALGYNAGA